MFNDRLEVHNNTMVKLKQTWHTITRDARRVVQNKDSPPPLENQKNILPLPLCTQAWEGQEYRNICALHHAPPPHKYEKLHNLDFSTFSKHINRGKITGHRNINYFS